MSRPRYWWYNIVKSIASRSLRGQIPDDFEVGHFINESVKKAYELTCKRNNGELRCNVINELLVNRYRNVRGAAMRLHISDRVIIRFISEFVYDVAKEIGIYKK